MMGRRTFLRTAGGLAGLAMVPAAARTVPQFSLASLRGAIDAGEKGLLPRTVDDQSQALARLIEKAAAADMPLFIPPGTYNVSNLTLPDNARITGVPGATRLVYSGNGHLIIAENRKRVSIANLVLDGGNRTLGDYARGLIQASNVDNLAIENCEIAGSAGFGISMERSGGKIGRNTISGAAQAAVHAMQSHDLSVTDNHVFDCGNGGILVHRWQAGDDGTLVTGNRVERIRADDGGTGQNGNGINVFRAGNVIVANNHVSDCAFSAIRSNSGSNVMITANQCLRSGETAVYSEFAFEGAMIAGNIVDGAANGISIANFREGGRLATVANNVVRNLSLTGPYVPEDGSFGTGIGVEADTAITGNVIELGTEIRPRAGLGALSAQRHGDRQHGARCPGGRRRLGRGRGRVRGRRRQRLPGRPGRGGGRLRMDEGGQRGFDEGPLRALPRPRGRAQPDELNAAFPPRTGRRRGTVTPPRG